MLSEQEGNLLDADAEALVNTVNTVGIMGKGIALQFKQAYPGNFRAYQAACRRGEVQLGRMFTYETGLLGNPRFVINFPTKGHWRARARLSDIETGLADLRHVVRDRKIRSIAIPPLGCGNGGLDWREVRPLIDTALGELPDVHVMVYPPEGTPAAESMNVSTARPTMTGGRAALLTTLGRYIRLSQLEQAAAPEGASLLEIQKLMYFLQQAGQPLRLSYVKARYGPYADNLNHVLQALEGHYLRGYGDRTQQVLKLSPIALMPGAEDEGQRWLADHPDETTDRINTVIRLVAGFASAYGLELLATVHWIATQEGADQIADAAALTQHIGSWNERKGRLFTEAHVRNAIDHLSSLGWVTAAQKAGTPSVGDAGQRSGGQAG
ncbi:MAG: type II toxin-antitoxin system antitoxin DNA ADP-ribosyl glycohydrolase DarG [Streptosporangiaceae bacterium]